MELEIEWGDGAAEWDLYLDSPQFQVHQYDTAGVYEICLTARNFVSRDQNCWNVTVYNPVLSHYQATFPEVHIGCPCGETPYLGTGTGLFTLSFFLSLLFYSIQSYVDLQVNFPSK